MFVFALVLFGEDLFEPVGLALGYGLVDEGGIMQDDERFAASVTAQNAHLRESTGTRLHLPLFDSYCSHRLRYFIE
jgi:hypothetical protein